MRSPALLLTFALLAATSVSPAAAQLSGGVGSSNSANRSFQTQNQIRGIEAQQRVNSNTTRLRMDSDRMNTQRSYGGSFRRGR